RTDPPLTPPAGGRGNSGRDSAWRWPSPPACGRSRGWVSAVTPEARGDDCTVTVIPITSPNRPRPLKPCSLLRRLRPRARVPEQPRPIALVGLVRRRALGLLPLVEARPNVVPVPAGRRLRVLGRPRLEEIRVLDAV